jgi:ferric-dicitrate binding protein FerR (iron transport regulator)
MDEKITFDDTFLAKWIAGEISDDQLKEFVSNSDFKKYKKLQSGVTLFEYLESPSEATLANIKNKIALKSKTKVTSIFTKSLMAIAASITLFFSIYMYFEFKEVNFQSDFGEQKTIALLDKSEVILNAKSSLSYTKKDWKNIRNIRLNGEAFFKVQKGSTFNVITDNGIVSVLGTQFKVNTQKNFFKVICYEGTVKVTYKKEEYILTTNKSVSIINGIQTQDTLNSFTKNPTWTEGESGFKSVPLKIVIIALENQFNIKIDSSSVDNSILFTGSFDNKNLTIALASVFKTTSINYQIKNKTIILSK